MYQLEVSLPVYQRLKQCLFDLHPEIELTLVSCDYALASLGFADQPPCVLHVDITRDEYENLLDELMDFEIAAFDMPYHSKEQQLYDKYGWMWDVFYSAVPLPQP